MVASILWFALLTVILVLQADASSVVEADLPTSRSAAALDDVLGVSVIPDRVVTMPARPKSAPQVQQVDAQVRTVHGLDEINPSVAGATPSQPVAPVPARPAPVAPSPAPRAQLVAPAPVAPSPAPRAQLVAPTPVTSIPAPRAQLVAPAPVAPAPAIPTAAAQPAAPAPLVTRNGPPGVVSQIPASAWRWMDAHGWKVEWRQGPGLGRVSEAQYATSTIVIWYETSRSDTFWVGAFGHELGHAVSYRHFNTNQMNEWNVMRGLSSWRWVPGTPSDFSVGEGDFAEAFMSYIFGHGIRSVGGPLTQQQRAWISANTPF